MADFASNPMQSLQSSSPLETLVRRTSSRRRRPAARPSTDEASGRQPGDSSQLSSSNLYPSQAHTPPKKIMGRPPSSPLLHTHFRGASTGTASSYNTSAEFYNRSLSSTIDDSRESYYDDDASVYSSATVSPYASGRTPRTPPDSPASHPNQQIRGHGSYYAGGSGDGVEGYDWPTNEPANAYARSRRSSDVDPYIYQASKDSTEPTVPTVVVSTADAPAWSPHPNSPSSPPGRVPSALPSGMNYSRPVRPGGGASEDEKRRVLDRNASRLRSPLASPHSSGMEPSQSSSSGQGLSPNGGSFPTSIPRSPNFTAQQLSSLSSPSPSRSPSPSATASRSQSPMMSTGQASPNGSSAPSTAQIFQSGARTGDAPLIPSSPNSLYSAYSYYNLDSPTSSSTQDTLQVPGAPPPPPQLSRPPRGPNALSGPSPSTPGASDGMTSDTYLQLGIQHHEANRLKESAVAFEQSAKMEDGSGVGMLMWGLTLRHGWGIEKNERLGFSWLRKAAEAAVGDLERARMGGSMDEGAVKGELVLAIYEVGQCFLRGWGVKKDQKMAVSYFQVAAKLGDQDAQAELAFCLANGRGCKKDRKEAAKWYRAAVAQGLSDVGLAWIYKEKFQ